MHAHVTCHTCQACESGSLFEGMLGDDLAACVTTAANANESFWGTYCPGGCLYTLSRFGALWFD